MKNLLAVFLTILIAEMGDKTQLATMLYATDSRFGRFGIFVAASAALVTASALAVVAGTVVTRFVPEHTLRIAAGVGFILVGIWTLISSS